MVQKAIDFATKVHEGQYRKGTDRPYIVHPMEVGKIVSTMTQDEEIISAAILHDTDKLSNMRDIDRDYPVCGEELWNRFRMKDKATIGWYYKGVREALREAFAETEAFAEYCSLIDKNFG